MDKVVVPSESGSPPGTVSCAHHDFWTFGGLMVLLWGVSG